MHIGGLCCPGLHALAGSLHDDGAGHGHRSGPGCESGSGTQRGQYPRAAKDLGVAKSADLVFSESRLAAVPNLWRVSMALKLRLLSFALGAEVCGIDVSRNLSEHEFGDIYRAFLEHGILLLRNQGITREQHIEFSRRFGELDRHDTLPRDRHPDHPEILLVTNEPKPSGAPSDSKYTGRQWHSDMSFTLVPSMGSLLRCVIAPPVGGDTMFANMYMAYDALSAGMQKMIADLHSTRPSCATWNGRPSWGRCQDMFIRVRCVEAARSRMRAARGRTAASVLAVLAAFTLEAAAQTTYPAKPIRIVIP